MEAFLAVGKQVAYQALEVPCPLNLVAYPLNLVACPWNWEAYPWSWEAYPWSWEASYQAVVGLHSAVEASQGRKAVEAMVPPLSGQGGPLDLVASC